MAVVVEPVLSLEKTLTLLAEGHEQPALDYKKLLDLSGSKDVCELAKDVCALQAEGAGGYIVIGVDGSGKPVPDLTEEMVLLLDESRLRAKLKRFFTEPLDIRSATHLLESGETIGLIYVGPSEFGFSVLSVDGEHSVGQGPNKKSMFVFRAGDVFVRHGTASEKWDDSDRSRIRDSIVAREKEAWRAEIRSELAATLTSIGNDSQSLSVMPSAAITWKIDEVGFEELVVELLRRSDDIPLRRLLLQAREDADSLFRSDSPDLQVLLDRITAVAALGLQLDRTEWFYRSVNALEKLYEVARQPFGVDYPPGPAATYWISIVARVHSLGALAVRFEKWSEVSYVATRRPGFEGLGEHYGSWLRHGITMAARANQLNEANSDVIARGRAIVSRLHSLRPDVDSSSEAVTDSLCQFDVLGALAVISETWDDDTSSFYPSFAKYYSRRSELAFLWVVEDGAIRQAVFPRDDESLADAIRAIQYRAQNENVIGYSAYAGAAGQKVEAFVEEYGSSANPAAIR